jgi:hypothetical protein
MRAGPPEREVAPATPLRSRLGVRRIPLNRAGFGWPLSEDGVMSESQRLSLLALLRAVEWSKTGELIGFIEHPYGREEARSRRCPVCGWSETQRHDENCTLAACIKTFEATSGGDLT